MTAPGKDSAPLPAADVLLRHGLRVALQEALLEEAKGNLASVRGAAELAFRPVRNHGTTQQEILLADGTKVGLISITKGAASTDVDEDMLFMVAARNEPADLEDYVEPAALTDPRVLALLSAHLPGLVSRRIKAAAMALYEKEIEENGGEVLDRYGAAGPAGERVKVATITHHEATGRFSYRPASKGAQLVREAFEAGALTLDGEYVTAAAEEQPAADEVPPADVPVPESEATSVPADDADARMERAFSRGRYATSRKPQHEPTGEQQAILDAFRTGENIVISARAGSGKTSSLTMIGAAAERKRGLYLAFNRAIVTDAKPKFGSGVQVSTAHALAMAAVGQKYRDRLNGPRVPANQVARILGIDGPLRVGDDRVLAPAQQARLVLETVDRFCRSADPELTSLHVPHKPGLDTPDAMAVLRSVLMPWARKAWADLTKTDGQLRFGHDVYLKLFGLSGPQLAADYILYDECQPTGTMVMVVRHPAYNCKAGDRTTVRYVPIECLGAGDVVVSYNRRGPRLRIGGSELTEVRSRRYSGELITVTTSDGHRSRYTPDHKCLALVGDALADKWVLYLMRRGMHYRVGITRGFYGHGAGQKTYRGVRSRAWEENADAAWVLDVFDDETDARVAEAFTSWRFRLPQMRFGDARGVQSARLSAFWNKIDDLTTHALECLEEFGRRVEYPFWTGGTGSYGVTRRVSVVRACNLLDGMQVIAADAMVNRAANLHRRSDLTPIKVRREFYAGDIWSLEVDEDHTYVADGLVTHNCQDADLVVQDIVLRQENSQLIAVGDEAQQLYEWRGATNAMANFPAKHRLTLSKSFRFGPAIATEANKWLAILEAEPPVTGSDRISSMVRPLEAADAVLCRTNAGTISEVIRATAAGHSAALVGGGKDIRALAEAAQALKEGRGTSHPELFAFRTWGEVQDHAENDPSGSDLKVLVNLIDEHGPEKIIEIVDSLTDEKQADVVISTAHKAKGREWDSVRIASDFRPPKGTEDDPDGGQVSPPDARLAYVSVTRAKLSLDRTGLAWVDDYVPHREGTAA